MSPNTILPEVTLRDSETHNVRAPRKRWRIIGGALSRFKELHYETQAERDRAAQALADEYGESVICEVWSFSHPQDELNRGWASDGDIHPTPKES